MPRNTDRSVDELIDRLFALGVVEQIFEHAEVILSPQQNKAIADYYRYDGDARTVYGIFAALANNSESQTAGTRKTHFTRAVGKLREHLRENGLDLDGWGQHA